MQKTKLTLNDPITINGVTKTFKEWAIENNIKPNIARQRVVTNGWTIQKALSEPIISKSNKGRIGKGNSPWRKYGR